MTEMMRRVAKAILDEGLTFERAAHRGEGENSVESRLARAAVEAMRELDTETIDAIAASYVLEAWPGMPFDKWPEGDAALMKSRLAKAVSGAFAHALKKEPA